MSLIYLGKLGFFIKNFYIFVLYNKSMNENPYFNPFRKHHVILLAHLEKELVNNKDKVDLIKFGDNTQHIFVNEKYYMTVNWSLV